MCLPGSVHVHLPAAQARCEIICSARPHVHGQAHVMTCQHSIRSLRSAVHARSVLHISAAVDSSCGQQHSNRQLVRPVCARLLVACTSKCDPSVVYVRSCRHRRTHAFVSVASSCLLDTAASQRWTLMQLRCDVHHTFQYHTSVLTSVYDFSLTCDLLPAVCAQTAWLQRNRGHAWASLLC